MSRSSVVLCLTLVWASLFAPRALSAERRLSLLEAIALARKNPIARAAAEQRRVADARADEARGARWPKAELTAFLAPSPEIRCLDAACTRTSPGEAQLGFQGLFAGLRVGVVQPLYTFGKISSAVDAADRASGATRAQTDALVLDLALDTARAYLAVDAARELATMLDDGDRELAKGRKGIAERLEKGDPDVTLQDRLRIETLGAEVQVRRSQAREAEMSALLALRALVGDPEADTQHAAFEPLDFELGGADGYLSRGRTARPELRAAEQGVLALEAANQLEKARWLPDVFVHAGFDLSRATTIDEPSSAFADDPFNASTAQLALVTRWTIDPGVQAARVDRTTAELNRARALSSAAERAGNLLVLQAHARASEARARLEAARSGESSARGWVASALQADAVGAASAKDLADAYLSYFTLRSRVIECTYDFNLAVFSLRRAIGQSPTSKTR